MNTLIRFHRIAFLTASLIAGTWQQASANIQIVIDISNLNAANFTATNGFSLNNSNSSTFADGLTLRDIFSVDASGFLSSFSGSTLSTSLDAEVYSNYDVFGKNLSIFNLYPGGPESPDPPLQNFSVSSAAFEGLATADLSSFSLTPGTTGDIVTGGFGGGDTIGQWQVVPESGHYGLLLGVASVALAVRRRLVRS